MFTLVGHVFMTLWWVKMMIFQLVSGMTSNRNLLFLAYE